METSSHIPEYSITLATLADTIAWGKNFGKLLLPGAVICLEGNLGAGKNTTGSQHRRRQGRATR